MSDAFITRRGGGGGLSPNSAVIHVNAPAGSTLELVKGGVTVKVLGPEKGHANNDGVSADWYYSVSAANYGTWTVTATRGDVVVAATKTITVEAAEQYDIKLMFRLYLYDYGDLCTAATGGWSNVTSSYGSTTFGTNYIRLNSSAGTSTVRTTNKLSRGDYTKLCILCTTSAAESGGSAFGLLTSYRTNTGRSDYVVYLNQTQQKYTEALLTLNIENYNAEYYVACSSYLKSTDIYQIYLDG